MLLDASRVETVDRLLSTNRIYKVPRYQRSFSWEKDHIELFWEDLIETKDDNSREDYFLGSMIFRQITENEMEIIDGQQRLAVITILLACIRDYYFDMGSMEGVSEINPIYIGRKKAGVMHYKLELNSQDNTFFRNYIQDDARERNFSRKRGLSTSQKLILNAHNIIFEKIGEELDKLIRSEDKKNFLEDLKNIITEKFKVLSTYVSSLEEAYVVFETLNDRGLDLSIADLLKNYLYSKAGGNLNAVRNTWEEIMNMLDGKEINNFLRCYWLSSKDLVREKQLYKALKNHLRDKGEVLSFVQELKNEAEVYRNIINPDDNYWDDDNLTNALKELKNLGIKQIYPLILSAYKKFGKSSDLKKIINWSISLTVRYSIICSLNPNKLEVEYSDAAIKLRRNKDLIFVKRRFLELIPGDEEFSNGFGEKELTNKKIARYLLCKIAKKMGVCGGDISIDENITLEHILPQKLTPEWEKYIEKNGLNHEDYLHKIGNLTLLNGPRNRNLSNKSFKEKSKIYNTSALKITKDICLYKEWNEENILKRQGDLVKIAKEIWKL